MHKSATPSRFTRRPSAVRHLLVLVVLLVMTGWGPARATRTEGLSVPPWEDTPIDHRLAVSPALSGRVLDRNGRVVAEPVVERRGTRMMTVVKRPYGRAMSIAGVGDTQVGPLGIQGVLPIDAEAGTIRRYPPMGPIARLLVGDSRLAAPPVPDVRIAPDAELSRAIYERLVRGGRQASVVVLEVPTGDIWAATDFPAPAPNSDKQPTARDRFNSVLATNLPGSTEKSASAAYLLQFGRGNPDASHFCDGKGCWKAHGTVTGLRSALLQSCNRWFAAEGQHFKREELEQFLLDLNIAPSAPGLPTGSPGLIVPAEKRGVPWTMVVGQELFESALGLATVYASLVDGRRVEPRMLLEVAGEPQKVVPRHEVVRPEVSATIRDLLGDNGRFGTARVVNQTYRKRDAGGKTGSAETDRGRPTDSVFVATAPASAPRWIVAVTIKGGGRGAVAGALAGEVLNLLP